MGSGLVHTTYMLSRYRTKMTLYKDYLGGKCQICGVVTNLEFDHVDPATKEFVITKKWDLSWAKMKVELDKCQLLCKFCHKKKSDAATTGPREHGTWGAYSRGKCRCKSCRDFFNQYRRALRHKRRRNITAYVPAFEAGNVGSTPTASATFNNQ